MRIIGGKHRGRQLLSPRDQAIRPTSDRAREALFDLLGHGQPPLPGARFLDLFAGSGAIGLEAYSRGAAEVWLIDRDLDLAARNVQALGRPPAVHLLTADATALGRPPACFDLASLDPPYGAGLAAPALRALQAGGWLAPQARIAVELAAKERLDLPPGYAIERDRRYGAARILILRA